MTTTLDPTLTVTGWEAALQAGWEVGGTGGTWSVEAGQLRLHVDQGGAASGLTLSSTQLVPPGAAFALEIHLPLTRSAWPTTIPTTTPGLFWSWAAVPINPGFKCSWLATATRWMSIGPTSST